MLTRPFRHGDDSGQALPVYLAAIGALLFLAFAYFAVGQASATRNGAQTAADAAALAAAQDRAGQLRDDLLNVFQEGQPLGSVDQLLNGVSPGLSDSCARAAEFAQDNQATATACALTADGDGYDVAVRSTDTIGTSVVPGTDHPVDARASAELTPLCTWQANPDSPSPTPTAPATPSPTPTGTPTPAPSASPPASGTLQCQGGTWTIDPTDLTGFPTAADLFHVHLTS